MCEKHVRAVHHWRFAKLVVYYCQSSEIEYVCVFTYNTDTWVHMYIKYVSEYVSM